MSKSANIENLKSFEIRIQASITDLARNLTASLGTIGVLRTEIHELRAEMKNGFEGVHLKLDEITKNVLV